MGKVYGPSHIFYRENCTPKQLPDSFPTSFIFYTPLKKEWHGCSFFVLLFTPPMTESSENKKVSPSSPPLSKVKKCPDIRIFLPLPEKVKNKTVPALEKMKRPITMNFENFKNQTALSFENICPSPVFYFSKIQPLCTKTSAG